MIYLMDLERICKSLTPVTSSEYTIGKGYTFHPEGLFSDIIFGPKDSSERRKNYSYIDLNCKILHPALISIIAKMNKKILLAINKKQSYTLKNGFLEEDENGEINGIISVIDNFVELISYRKEEGKRKDLQNMLLNNHKKNLIFISKCLVIPAGFRDALEDEVHGGLRFNPLNEYYVKIIRQSNQLVSFKSGDIFEIFSSRMMQLIEDLYNYIITKISKKEGLIRQNILGKRADFSGRAVITGGSSEVKVDEIGVPFKILVRIFEPFIIHDLLNSGKVDKAKLGDAVYKQNKTTLSVPGIRSLFTGVQAGDVLVPELEEILKISVVRVISDKVVIAKRDPALHAESVQAFKPVMVDGDTIRINPLKVAGFNADFDGDQMALYTPLTKEAIQEARDKMICSLSTDSLDMLSDEFKIDIVAGIYFLTKDPDKKEKPITIKNDDELYQMHPSTIIKYDNTITTAGRIIFNKNLPSKKFHINEPINKSKMKKLISEIYIQYKETDKNIYIDTCHNITKLGMKYYTLSGSTFSLDDLKIPPHILKLKEKLQHAKNIEEANEIVKEMEKQLIEYLKEKNPNLSVLIEGGALKGYTQVRQILVSKGLIKDPEGRPHVINSSYSDGFTTKEYFEGGSSSRIGMIDRAHNTSSTGYMSRQFVYALQRVEADPGIKDCKTKRYVTIKVSSDIAKRLKGRFIISEEGPTRLFNEKHDIDKVVHLRSPIYCISKRICRTCYGELLDQNRTHYVGIVAAQLLGERLTQTIMRTFHVGGAISIKTIDILKEISSILTEKEKKILFDNFVQKDIYLHTKKEGKIILDFSLYLEPKKDIHVHNDYINLNYGYFKMTYDNVEFDITLDNKIRIDLKDKNVIKDSGKLIIEFSKNSVVFECTPTEEVFSEQVKIISALLSGKSPWKSADHFLMKVYDQYKSLSFCDLVHLEILVSNLLRDKGNPSYPARLNKKYNPTIINLKKIPHTESWLQGLNFENPKDSIMTGLLYDRPVDETILEKIVTGNF